MTVSFSPVLPRVRRGMSPALRLPVSAACTDAAIPTEMEEVKKVLRRTRPPYDSKYLLRMVYQWRRIAALLNTQSRKASSINLVITNRRDFLRLTTSAAILPSVQDSSQNPTFSTEVKVVNVLATVRNKSGQVVRDLSKEDFVLLENGKPQTIRYFSRESDLPLTVGLLVDTSLSQTRVLENERGASYRFLEQVLSRKEDKAVVVQFDQAIVIRQNLTSSHKDLQDTLSLLDSPNAQQ